jgi:hypothetical protein
MPCTVSDLNLAGAELVVASGSDLPQVFRLLVEGSEFEADCTILDQSGDRVEVAFT